MEVLDRSSSNDLSSAPSSDIEQPFPTRPILSHSNTITVASNSSHPQNAITTKSEKASAQPSATRQEGAPKKQSKPRKKKEVDPNAPPAPEKEKKPRKPRASAGTSGRASKKLKTEEDPPPAITSQHATQTTDLSSSRLVQPAPFVADSKPVQLNEVAKVTQNGFSNQHSALHSQPQSPSIPRYQTTPQPQPAAPRSRNIFDPVRGIERASEQPQIVTYPTLTGTPPRPSFRPSASPAISSIINHPEPPASAPIAFQPSARLQVARSIEESATVNGTTSTPMNLDGASSAETTSRKSVPNGKPSAEAENKPKRAKEQPPPMPVGSGLLNSAFFGGDASGDRSDEVGKGVNIVLQIDLKKDENKIFNFARMAEEKYGFAAVYPRQAAQKARLAKVAAAGAALERTASNGKRGEISVAESGDEDLSVDIDRDSNDDGDIQMTGINGTNENSGTDGPAPRQRRKRKDEYDADDPFVDDSEALWEAQAAASKDGFFVYMGALVTEDKPTGDKAEGISKRGGRGRGRGNGVGSRGGRGGAASAAGGEGSGRGGATSSRGTGVTRKPRITKAERQQRDLEKKQREQVGSALATKVQTAPP